jgi:hypothetical protein
VQETENQGIALKTDCMGSINEGHSAIKLRQAVVNASRLDGRVPNMEIPWIDCSSTGVRKTLASLRILNAQNQESGQDVQLS